MGTAVLVKDEILGKVYWVSYREETKNEVAFTEQEPLVFPPQAMEIGTRIYLLKPKEKDE